MFNKKPKKEEPDWEHQNMYDIIDDSIDKISGQLVFIQDTLFDWRRTAHLKSTSLNMLISIKDSIGDFEYDYQFKNPELKSSNLKNKRTKKHR